MCVGASIARPLMKNSPADEKTRPLVKNSPAGEKLAR